MTITGSVQQTIQFGPEDITRINTGNPNEFKYKLSAKASSGLTVTYSLENPSIDCASLNGDILTFDATKELRNVVLNAHQLGNNYYAAAPDASAEIGLVQFHGTITDSTTYEPIVGAKVNVYREQPMARTPEQIAEDNERGRVTYPSSGIFDLVDAVVTDGDGFYSTTCVQGVSRFKIEVIGGAGYMNVYYDFRAGTGRGSRGITYTWANSITTSDAPVLYGGSQLVDLELPPQPIRKGAASVEGKVYIGELGEEDFIKTVEDVTVYLLSAINPRSATPRFSTFYASMHPTKETNPAWISAGSYKFDNLPYGRYYLGITYPGSDVSNLSTGFQFMVDSTALDTAYFTRDFLINKAEAYTQRMTPAKEDISAEAEGISVYPNPTTNGIFTITSQEGAYVLTILNEAQQVVLAEQVSDAQYQVNISAQANGLYFVVADFGDKRIIKKIVLQK